jgi:hypothetical protein
MADIGHRCSMASQDIAHNPMHQIILPLRWKAISLAALCIAPTVIKSVQALEVSAYAKLNIHAEYVEPDKETAQVKKYTGLRDAYSQIGIIFEQELSDNQQVSFDLFAPVDLANLKFQDTWDHDADAPQYEIHWTTPFGEVKAGYLYLPYYDAIASVVDRFSSYYTGFATYSAFRTKKSLVYVSPSFNGFNMGTSVSANQGLDGDNLLNLTLNWKNDKTSVSLGLQDQQGLLDTRLWGISASHKPIDGLFIGIKTEVFDTHNSGGYGGDGDRSTAAFVSYDYGEQTFKAMLADTDNYGKVSYTLGWDYRHSDTVKYFVEYYAEEETSAITAERAGSEVFDTDASGGRAVAAGVSLNFAW